MTQQNGLAAALAQLQSNLPRIEKTETANVQTKQGAYSYSYANLANLSDQILPLLGKLGLSFTCRPTMSGERFVLAYRLWHTGGEFIEGEYPLPSGGTPQSIGSAITYGRRYCLCSVTGVAPEDDDDGATAEAEASSRRGTAQRAAPRQRQAATAASPARTAQRGQAEAPLLPGEDPNAITKPQLQKLAIAAKEASIDSDRETYLDYIEHTAGRRVESSKDLTKAEAHKVIDALENDKGNAGSAEQLVDAFPDEPKEET